MAKSSTNPKYLHDIKLWLEFAKYDLKSAKWQHKGKIYTSACYAGQQSAEKSLKSLSLFINGNVPRIHSLQDIVKTLAKIDTSIIQADARNLEKYYITTRYPGEYGGPDGLYSHKDSAKAIQSARKILSFVTQTLKSML
jgi:HEPN domain-containing protein